MCVRAYCNYNKNEASQVLSVSKWLQVIDNIFFLLSWKTEKRKERVRAQQKIILFIRRYNILEHRKKEETETFIWTIISASLLLIHSIADYLVCWTINWVWSSEKYDDVGIVSSDLDQCTLTHHNDEFSSLLSFFLLYVFILCMFISDDVHNLCKYVLVSLIKNKTK